MTDARALPLSSASSSSSSSSLSRGSFALWFLVLVLMILAAAGTCTWWTAELPSHALTEPLSKSLVGANPWRRTPVVAPDRTRSSSRTASTALTTTTTRRPQPSRSLWTLSAPALPPSSLRAKVLVAGAGFGGVGFVSSSSAFAADSEVPAMVMANITKKFNDTSAGDRVVNRESVAFLHQSVTGIVKTYLLMPLATLKYCLQEGRALPKSPFEWYRGVLPNAAFMVPITASQIWANGVIERFVSRNGTRALKPQEKVGCAVAAGALSALLYAPLDLVVIQQQKLKLNLLGTLAHIQKEVELIGFLYQYGATKFMRGLKACMVREAVYTGGYLGLAPVLSTMLKTSSPFFQSNEFFAGLAGSIVAGVAASLITHPVDTAKTNMQADVVGVQYASTRQAIIDIFEESGFASLYKGGVARCAQVSSSVFVLSSIRSKALEMKRKANKEDEKLTQ